MIGLFSILAILLIVGFLAWGWYKGWSILFSLVAAMASVLLLGLLTTPGTGVSMVRSPVLQELAWRPEYLALSAWPHWWTAFTSMFLHADVMHFLVNIVIFVFIGMGFEERIGRGRFLMVFLATGLFGTVMFSVTTLGSTTPVVGASGAVFGIIGAYATMYPRDRVVLFFILIIPNVPVYIAAVLYTAVELVRVTLFAQPGVAHYAHIGGLIAGVFLAFLLIRIGVREEAVAPTVRLEVDSVRALIKTDEQREYFERLEANLDEPEIAEAWLEKLARSTHCPQCDSRLESAKGAMRCSCGYKIVIQKQKRK